MESEISKTLEMIADVIEKTSQPGRIEYLAIGISLISVVVSGIAILFAVRVADKQNKITLFEKRYRLYTLLLSCQTFALALKAAEDMQDAQRVFLITFYPNDLDNKRLDDTSYISACYLSILQELSLSEFLFCSDISNGVLNIVKEMSGCLNDWFQLEDQSTFTKHKNDYIALYDDIKSLTTKMKLYLNLSD